MKKRTIIIGAIGLAVILFWGLKDNFSKASSFPQLSEEELANVFERTVNEDCLNFEKHKNAKVIDDLNKKMETEKSDNAYFILHKKRAKILGAMRKKCSESILLPIPLLSIPIDKDTKKK